MKNYFQDKIILVTGGAGSIGSALVKHLLEYKPKTVRALDINETGLFNLKHQLKTEKIRLLIGDVRDKDRLKRAVEDVDIIFHAAALKHVTLCEMNPLEAIQTNVLGTKNLIEVAMDSRVEKFITISTDKAVNPINVLGASKLLAERLTVSANNFKGSRKTIFSCVRFGNVLNSQGSVVPIFKEQVENGGPLTITDVSMTRFIMSISKATELVLKAAEISKGGEIFILKMSSIRIEDLARAVIEEIAPQFGYEPKKLKLEYIGRRDGERMYEELMNEDETDIAFETDNMFILPASNYKDRPDNKRPKIYKSRDSSFLSVAQIRELLRNNPD